MSNSNYYITISGSSNKTMCPERVKKQNCADGERTRICVPADYIKFELPEDERPTYVKVGVDIKDIPKVNDKDFSITMNAYFIVKWQDRRLIVEKRNRTSKHFIPDRRLPDQPQTSTTTTSSLLMDSRLVLHVQSQSLSQVLISSIAQRPKGSKCHSQLWQKRYTPL